MLKRIIQFVGLAIGLFLGWRLGLILLERTAPRRLTLQPLTSPASTAPAEVPPSPPSQAEPAPEPASTAPNGLDQESEVLPYCMGCRQKRQVVNAHEERLANGRLVLKGECAECGRTVMRFISETSERDGQVEAL